MRTPERWSRRIAAVAAIVVGAVLVSAPALADVDFGGRAGAYTDETRAFFGAELLTPLDSKHVWFANPNVEFAFADESDLTSLNGDFHYDIDTQGRFAVWFGGGPSVLFIDREFADDDTDVGLNLLAGFGAKRGDVRPYFQGKYIVADDPTAVVAVGVRF